MIPQTAVKSCPRYSKCSVNDCPLCPGMFISDSSDPEHKCTLAKSIRHRIGKQFNLSNQGLKSRELQAKKLWESLSPEQQQAKKDNIQKISLITRLSAKGYKIAPKTNIISETHKQNDINSPEQASETPILNEDKVQNG